MSRTLNVIRMQLVNRDTFIWVPALVLGGAVVVCVAIFALIDYVSDDAAPAFAGGAQAPLWYFAVVGAQALALSFPFSQAMSVTRREFYLGTLATAALTSLAMAAIFVIGGLIEQATNGWGLDGYMFYLPWVWEAGPLTAGLAFFALAMLFFTIGFLFATLLKRFGLRTLMLILLGLALLLVGGAALLTVNDGWPAFGMWFVDTGALGLTLWVLLGTAVMAAISYGALRRATV